MPRPAVWLLAGVMLGVPSASAEDPLYTHPAKLERPPRVARPPRRSYKEDVEAKAATGLLYLVTSPIHLFEEPLDGTIHGPPVVGTIGGIGMGLMCSSVMGLSGAVNFATAWWPGWWIDARRHYPSCILGIDEGDFSTILGP